MKRLIAFFTLVALFTLAACTQFVEEEFPEVVVLNSPPIFSDSLLLNGIPGETYLTVTQRYIVDLRYRAADMRGPWTGIVDEDGDDITVLSVRAWIVLWGERVEDGVYCPPREEGAFHAAWRAGESNAIEPAFVLYPGAGYWVEDGVLVCPYPEIGYANKPPGWWPLRSGEGCNSTYHPPTQYIVEVVVTDGIDVVSHTYVLQLSASWGESQNYHPFPGGES